MSTVLKAYEATPDGDAILAVIKSVQGSRYRVSVYTTVFLDSIEDADAVFNQAMNNTTFSGSALNWVDVTDEIEEQFDKVDREVGQHGL